ncbi:helicase associated domain-containing protein [Streptomyces sp. NPDC001890]|uniref:helicase associated domain-containing protein n=1 Tax=Streptomyces sp. NPDC001890 TaxID=3364620 RepID=UPI003688D103
MPNNSHSTCSTPARNHPHTPTHTRAEYGFPLGTRLADQRKTHKAGQLDPGRVKQLAGLGMVWSHQDVAFEEGLHLQRVLMAHHPSRPAGSGTRRPASYRGRLRIRTAG